MLSIQAFVTKYHKKMYLESVQRYNLGKTSAITEKLKSDTNWCKLIKSNKSFKLVNKHTVVFIFVT